MKKENMISNSLKNIVMKLSSSSGGDDRVKELLIQLDMILTAQGRPTAEHTSKQFKSIERLVFDSDNVYYLSDGGYSRVGFSERDNFRVFLTTNSTEKVKTRWNSGNNNIESLKEQIQQIIQAWYNKAVEEEEKLEEEGQNPNV